MRLKPSIVALAVALALGATPTRHASAAEENAPKTRAQVLAELEQARADGSFYLGGEGKPRGLARARLAAQEERARRERANAADGRSADRAGT